MDFSGKLLDLVTGGLGELAREAILNIGRSEHLFGLPITILSTSSLTITT